MSSSASRMPLVGVVFHTTMLAVIAVCYAVPTMMFIFHGGLVAPTFVFPSTTIVASSVPDIVLTYVFWSAFVVCLKGRKNASDRDWYWGFWRMGFALFCSPSAWYPPLQRLGFDPTGTILGRPFLWFAVLVGATMTVYGAIKWTRSVIVEQPAS